MHSHLEYAHSHSKSHDNEVDLPLHADDMELSIENPEGFSLVNPRTIRTDKRVQWGSRMQCPA